MGQRKKKIKRMRKDIKNIANTNQTAEESMDEFSKLFKRLIKNI